MQRTELLKFYKKTLLFVVLVLGLLSFFEYKARQIYETETDMELQWKDYKQVASDVETVVLGHSHCDKGLDPKYLNTKAFNLAYSSQSIYYDAMVLEKVLKMSPKIKNVIWCLTHFSFVNDETNYALHLVRDYQRFMDIDPHRSIGLKLMLRHSALYTHKQSFVKDWSKGKRKIPHQLYTDRTLVKRPGSVSQ